ncbi:MAG TPA: hypothetical protein VMN36_01435 [Verrucomicrobiales bacterium]|nr:hypothetical protein [Verrucomicrobiales bacterium]
MSRNVEETNTRMTRSAGAVRRVSCGGGDEGARTSEPEVTEGVDDGPASDAPALEGGRDLLLNRCRSQ